MNLMRALWKGLRGRSGDAADGTLDASLHGANLTDDPAAPDGAVVQGEEIIKEPPMEIDGRVMSADEFVRYVEELDIPSPLPTRIFLHHTWRPTKEDWRGRSTLMAMKAYDERRLWRDHEGRLHEGWTAGPHLFIADDGIWLFSDLRYDGVGVYGHNYRSRHIEVVGNYDQQAPSGATLQNTIVALGILHERLGLDIRKLNFHRDFSTKSCPGWAVSKAWIIPQVEAWIEGYRRSRSSKLSAARQAILRVVENIMVPTNPHAALASEAARRGLLGALTHEIPIEVDDRPYVVQVFAEALIVPVNEWDNVRSLREHEEALDDVNDAAHRVTGDGRDLDALWVDEDAH